MPSTVPPSCRQHWTCSQVRPLGQGQHHFTCLILVFSEGKWCLEGAQDATSSASGGISCNDIVPYTGVFSPFLKAASGGGSISSPGTAVPASHCVPDPLHFVPDPVFRHLPEVRQTCLSKNVLIREGVDFFLIEMRQGGHRRKGFPSLKSQIKH